MFLFLQTLLTQDTAAIKDDEGRTVLLTAAELGECRNSIPHELHHAKMGLMQYVSRATPNQPAQSCCLVRSYAVGYEITKEKGFNIVDSIW